jgi:hypothetical protein
VLQDLQESLSLLGSMLPDAPVAPKLLQTRPFCCICVPQELQQSLLCSMLHNSVVTPRSADSSSVLLIFTLLNAAGPSKVAEPAGQHAA